MRTALTRRLRAEGLCVQSFASAREYLAAAATETMGCLVLDVHLGAMSGFELADFLCEQGATVPIILMTAYDVISSAELARRSGPEGYLRKPFDTGELIVRVRRALRRAQNP